MQWTTHKYVIDCGGGFYDFLIKLKNNIEEKIYTILIKNKKEKYSTHLNSINKNLNKKFLK